MNPLRSPEWLNQTPVKFDVIGSDDCSDDAATFSPEALLSVEDAGFAESDEAKSWIIPEDFRRERACWGLEFHSNLGSPDYVAVHKILMWEARGNEWEEL